MGVLPSPSHVGRKVFLRVAPIDFLKAGRKPKCFGNSGVGVVGCEAGSGLCDASLARRLVSATASHEAESDDDTHDTDHQVG